MSAFTRGLIVGALLLLCVALSVGTTFEPHEVEVGQQMCIKNGGLKFMNRERPLQYIYTCRDGAKFDTTDLGEVK